MILGGTVDAFSRAFGVELNRYQHAWRHLPHAHRNDSDSHATGGDYRRRVWPRQSSAGQGPFSHTKKYPNAVSAQAAAGSFTALQVAQAYNFPANTDGTGQTIGIVELGGGYRAADLTTYFKNLGITAPKVTTVSVDGGTNSPTGSASGPDGEVELDIEVAGAVAPGAQIVDVLRSQHRSRLSRRAHYRGP